MAYLESPIKITAVILRCLKKGIALTRLRAYSRADCGKVEAKIKGSVDKSKLFDDLKNEGTCLQTDGAKAPAGVSGASSVSSVAGGAADGSLTLA